MSRIPKRVSWQELIRFCELIKQQGDILLINEVQCKQRRYDGCKGCSSELGCQKLLLLAQLAVNDYKLAPYEKDEKMPITLEGMKETLQRFLQIQKSILEAKSLEELHIIEENLKTSGILP
jgi:hypothetical protein